MIDKNLISNIILILAISAFSFEMKSQNYTPKHNPECSGKQRNSSIEKITPFDTIRIGLYYAEMTPKQKSPIGNSNISVLKIDPKHYNFNYLHLINGRGRAQTAKEWANKKDLVAVTNANLSKWNNPSKLIGYAKDYDYINNSDKPDSISKGMILFNRKDTTVPEFQIGNLEKQNADSLINDYHTCIQGRLSLPEDTLDKPGFFRNCIASRAVIASDEKNNAYFIVSRSPYSIDDFEKVIFGAPLDIKKMQFVNSGPPSCLYVNHKNFEKKIVGSYHFSTNRDNKNKQFTYLQSMVGISSKKEHR